MKIGWISQALPYLPSRGGFRLYGGNLIRCLSRHHQIDLVTLLTDDDAAHTDWTRAYCHSLETIPTDSAVPPLRVANLLSSYVCGRPLHFRQEMAAILRRALDSKKWDVLHVEGAFVAGLIPAELPVAKVLSLHDSWTLRYGEMLKCSQRLREKLEYTVLRYCEPRYERLLYPRFERCVVVARPDYEAVQNTVPKAKVALIPYGTDTEYFRPMPVRKEPATLVFHSHLGYPPNIEASLEFANDILPLIRREVPEAIFHLVGAAPGPKIKELASRLGIRLSADLDDLRPAVCSSRIYVCAIRYGTGLKSKVLEAMAMQMPIVAYHPGSTVGIDCVYGKHLLAAESPQQFAAHVVDLLRHPDKAERTALAGRKLVEEKYSWESRACAFEQLYERVIEERHSRSDGVRRAAIRYEAV